MDPDMEFNALSALYQSVIQDMKVGKSSFFRVVFFVFLVILSSISANVNAFLIVFLIFRILNCR
ncbi:unnamed protein product [Haemonchus placei]|uniref:Ovule protein n=1 Tax=Haemonchus placei TaxID=6290 RepID=A0A0N4X429_HAEPC|nr:unnamed protein product [Haemonchus placei]